MTIRRPLAQQDALSSDLLVSTDWADDHVNDKAFRFVEVDVDTTQYEQDHLPNAVGWNWQTQLQDPVTRDILSKAAFEGLLGASGISPQTPVVLYGDNNNWFAAYAFWLLRYYGHDAVKIVDGGRKKLLAEGRKLVKDAPRLPQTTYRVTRTRPDLRATRDLALETARENLFAKAAGIETGRALVDVRSPDEFTGKILAPPGLAETAQRGGHIPGAVSIPWSQAVRDDGTFKAVEELRVLYEGKGVTPDKEVVAYCRIGERSSHTWFVLRHLLGFPNVKNYDGSWTEYGNLVGVPIEKP